MDSLPLDKTAEIISLLTPTTDTSSQISAQRASNDARPIEKASNAPLQCRFCQADVTLSMVDLGLSPLCENFICQHDLDKPELFIPLEVMVCTHCWLAQTGQVYSSSEIFDDDYGYFSSYSISWLAHAKRYVEMATERFSLDENSFVVEVASNRWLLAKKLR